MIYLDNAATTPVKPEVVKAMLPWFTEGFGNPSSRHEMGIQAANALAEARERVAKWLGCRPSEVIFTSGGTESNNAAIKGLAIANPKGKHIISCKTEHESVLESLKFLERIHGFEIEWLPTAKDGSISIDDFKSAIRSDTTLVTLMTANNEIGSLHPISEFAEICANLKVAFHTDAVQSVGWQNLNVQTLGVTALSLSGHKFGAPKGAGILYLSSRAIFEPLLHGGGQEFERRSSTESVANAMALATALEIAPEPMGAREATSTLRNAFVEAVLENVPGAQLTGPAISHSNRHPAIASFVFEKVNGETLLLELETQGVICSSGSACAAGKDDPSHVLMALQYGEELARTSVRFSFGHETTATQVEDALNALVSAHRKLVG